MDAKTKGAGHCGGDQAPKNDRLGSAINSKTNLARSQTQAVVCATCGRRTIRKARQQRYCSTRCREQGKERSRKAFVGGDTGAPPNPPKKENKNNVLQGGKSGSSFPINLLGGGSWQWPKALQLDRTTREKICRAEISELSEWPPDVEGPMRMERG
jgi:hypothetical protein